MTIIDPEADWTLDAEEFRSKSRNCPFHGWRVKGRAVMTIVEGDVKREAGAAVSAAGGEA